MGRQERSTGGLGCVCSSKQQGALPQDRPKVGPPGWPLTSTHALVHTHSCLRFTWKRWFAICFRAAPLLPQLHERVREAVRAKIICFRLCRLHILSVMEAVRARPTFYFLWDLHRKHSRAISFSLARISFLIQCEIFLPQVAGEWNPIYPQLASYII